MYTPGTGVFPVSIGVANQYYKFYSDKSLRSKNDIIPNSNPTREINDGKK